MALTKVRSNSAVRLQSRRRWPRPVRILHGPRGRWFEGGVLVHLCQTRFEGDAHLKQRDRKRIDLTVLPKSVGSEVAPNSMFVPRHKVQGSCRDQYFRRNPRKTLRLRIFRYLHITILHYDCELIFLRTFKRTYVRLIFVNPCELDGRIQGRNALDVVGEQGM